MKTQNLAVALLAVFVCTLSGAAETAVQRTLKQFQKKREADLAAAAEPINRRYKEALQQLLRSSTQSNDLEGAVAIQAEIDSLVSSKFLGRWFHHGRKEEYAEFAAGGRYKTRWGGGSSEGTWKVTGENELTVSFPNKDLKHIMRLSADGKTVTRTNDGYDWSSEE